MALRFTVPSALRDGTYTSASIQIPDPSAGWASWIRFRPVIRAQDMNDPSLSFWFRFEWFDPVEGVWTQRGLGGGGWTGGPGALPPEVVTSREYLAGKTIRLILDVPVAMRLGATLDDFEDV